ncbi:hypothetical protein UA08_07361 [Talaromyces atroroseus]|uniref:AMP-dependent synthetase/ligase domain-containing protein n=1 Tax=Talaromyces atroroseus TaxID=1441469 RepID=A0A225ADX1_TALAT|nr:hypothetical protein UA08_07361 [Talaromyces atroroseus]OKL57203.1 hypothetical protein UA08_07361 [Talaromyces atroroseus]
MLLDSVADAVCCALAILHLGFVWIPLDTRNHEQRLRKLHCDGLKLVNVYGPAEITLACAKGIVPLTDADDSCVDHLLPSPNYEIQITDADMNILPVGFLGEICISGQGSSSVVRKYRSGDKGRILPDGTLEILGRLDGDNQVKIHGFRVEFDEIANAIVKISNGAIVNPAASLRNTPSSDIIVDRIPAFPNGTADMDAVNILPINESDVLNDALLEVQLGVKVSMPDLFHASTLRSMARLVANASDINNSTTLSPSKPAVFVEHKDIQSTINWDVEIASMVDGLPQPSPTLPLSNKTLLNGFSGLIVHCLAIRPDEYGKPRHVSVKNDKIIEYVGDLSTLHLSLSDSQFMFLSEHADVILHNGADVSLLKTYRSLRRANVVSTRTLCEMAIPRRLPLYYVSTASVAKVVHLEAGQPLLEVPALPAVPDLLNSVDGYASSKWHNELPTYVHRRAHVVGKNSSELDAVGMLMKYSLSPGQTPHINSENITGQWDFITVQDMARDLVHSTIESASSLTLQQKTQRIKFPIFLNHCSDINLCHNNLRDYLESVAGRPPQEIDMKEWLAAASPAPCRQPWMTLRNIEDDEGY